MLIYIDDETADSLLELLDELTDKIREQKGEEDG